MKLNQKCDRRKHNKRSNSEEKKFRYLLGEKKRAFYNDFEDLTTSEVNIPTKRVF